MIRLVMREYHKMKLRKNRIVLNDQELTEELSINSLMAKK